MRTPKTRNGLALALCLGLFALPKFSSAQVTFNVTYESGSQWETHPQAATAKANLELLLSDLGGLFIQTATIDVFVNDDETEAFASAGADAHDYVTLQGKAGEYFASGVWIKIINGVDINDAAPDCTISWNWDINGLYGGDVNAFLDRIRGLTRHEIMHPLGMGSTLTHDLRGSLSTATVHDAFLVDANEAPVLGAYDEASKRFRINNYALTQEEALDSSGIRFQARIVSSLVELQDVASIAQAQGNPAVSSLNKKAKKLLLQLRRAIKKRQPRRKIGSIKKKLRALKKKARTLPIVVYRHSIDFSHTPIVSYDYARPGGPGFFDDIVEEDKYYLRGLGYFLN